MDNTAKTFSELRVYEKAFDLQQAVFLASRSFPSDERFSLTDQIRRSARSVGANIAEAWRKRRYSAHFISKLSDADAELAETQHWLAPARACEYMTPSAEAALLRSTKEIGAMIGAMLNNPEKFCRE